MGNEFFLTDQRLEDLPGLVVPGSSGAVVSFWGRVRSRNEGRDVTGMEYSAYEDLARKEGARIVAEAVGKFGLEGARAAHRIGTLAVGEAAVVVEVASGHRGEGFEACRWIIDEVKIRVPIWKHESYAGGPTGPEKEWLSNGGSGQKST